MNTPETQPQKVLIAGGGVAGLEAALALADLAGDRVGVTMLAPEPEFVYRPMRVQEPFGGPLARQYSLKDIANDVGFELKQDAFKWLDPEQRIVHTERGDQFSYDSLLLALGARLNARFKHAVTLDDRQLDQQLHGLLQDVEAGYVHKLAFIAPGRMAWPLPLYELALMTARRAYDMNEDVSVTIVTAEDAPLAVFGATVSETVQQLLERNGILTLCSTHAETPEPGQRRASPGRTPAARRSGRRTAGVVRAVYARRAEARWPWLHLGRCSLQS